MQSKGEILYKMPNSDEKNEKTSEKCEVTSTDQKKSHKLSKSTKHTLLVSSVYMVCFGIIGGFGGFALFRWLNPESSGVYNAIGYGNIPTVADINTAKAGGTLVASYNTNKTAYSLANFALYKQANYSYTLNIGKGTVVSSGITQNIVSGTYNTPDETFSQNISSSSIVHTADRVYDKHDGSVTAYNCKTASDWANNPTAKDITYDDYIASYGKLNKNYYYATTATYAEDHPITDRYLCTDYSEYKASSDSTKHYVNSVIIYDIGPKTVTSSSISETATGYEIKVELTPNKGTFKSSVQMKTTGGLNSYPSFTSSNLTFEVDTDFNLVSSYAEDQYTAVVGPINSPATQKFYQYYFHSDTSSFNNVNVTIPEISDTSDFSGYQLFPTD